MSADPMGAYLAAFEKGFRQGDTIVVVSREEGQVAATGRRYQVSGVQRFVIRDGRIALIEEHIVPFGGE